MNLERLARMIMRKCKGWSVKQAAEDRAEFRLEHEAELYWILGQLQRVQRSGRIRTGHVELARARAASATRRKPK